MIEGIPKISITIICYKQEKLIKRAIDSLLVQKDYIYEICVSDDCSPDGTWEILNQYSKENPGLFKLHSSDSNVGIFENVEYTWQMPTGDIVYSMAGDDEAGAGWFKKVVDFISDNSIDYKNNFICIYGDYKNIYPSGDSIVFHNNLVTKSNNLLKLSLRRKIGNRGCCFSRNVLERFRKVSQGRSHIAEDAQDRQLQIFSEKNYYIPSVGNIYYSHIGVSSKVDEETLLERAKIRPYAFSLFESWGVKLDEKDRMYSLECFPAYERVLYRPSIKNVFRWLLLLVKSHDSSMPYSWNSIRSIVFGVRRRLPHRKPIESK